MSIVAELVRNICQTRFEAFDPIVVERARMRIIDVIGCTIAGAAASGCTSIIELVKDWAGKEESTILVHGGKVPAHDAAMVNSIMGRSHDYEACNPFVDGKAYPGHISGTTVPTAMALSEMLETNGRELLTALIVGDDLAARINAASDFTLDSGWDCTGTANMFGATAVAAKLWGLDEEQMLNAFGIVINQLSGTMQNIFDGVQAFKLPQGLAARAGIFSAALARKGFTGVKDPLLSKWGYFALYCRTNQVELLTKNLGDKFYSDITFKPYPCCRVTHGAIDCALNMLNTHDLKPEDIDEVTVEITPAGREFATGHPFGVSEVNPISAAFSFQYAVANALLRGSVVLKHFEEESVKDPRVMELVHKIRLNASIFPESGYIAGMKIRTKGGTIFENRVKVARGMETVSPLTRVEKEEKFLKNAAFSKTVRPTNAKKALRLLEKIEELDNVSRVVELLAV